MQQSKRKSYRVQVSTSSSAFTASRSRGKGGTDLGLAICREIVSSWADTISVESAVGQGTTVHVALPRAL